MTTVEAGVSATFSGNTLALFKLLNPLGNMQSAISFGSKLTKGAVKRQEVEITVPSVLTPVYFTVQVWRTAPVWLAATHPL